MIKPNLIKLRKTKSPEIKLGRIVLEEKSCRELTWYWKPFQHLLKELNEKDKDINQRHGNYREMYIETCMRPNFYVDVRKRFDGNKETMSCNRHFKMSPSQLAMLEGLTSSVVFHFVRQDYYDTYEIVELNPSSIVISYSGVPNEFGNSAGLKKV